MASWKCVAYIVVATTLIVLIILLNFDYLPKRKLSEELELSTKSGFKLYVAPTEGSTTTTNSRTISAVEKVRPLHFHAVLWFLRKYAECFLVKIRKTVSRVYRCTIFEPHIL